MVVERFTLGTRAHTFGSDFMTKVFRKGRVERTGRTVLNAAETPYMGANYRTGASGASTGGNSSGVGPPSGSAGEGSAYVDTNTGGVYYYYSGAWH